MRRTPVTILSAHSLILKPYVVAQVSGFAGPHRILPATLLPAPYAQRPQDAVGLTFMAWANIGALDVNDLVVQSFEPEPLNTETFEGK